MDQNPFSLIRLHHLPGYSFLSVAIDSGHFSLNAEH